MCLSLSWCIMCKHGAQGLICIRTVEFDHYLAQGSFSSHKSFVSRAISARAIPSSVNSTELSLSSTL